MCCPFITEEEKKDLTEGKKLICMNLLIKKIWQKFIYSESQRDMKIIQVFIIFISIILISLGNVFDIAFVQVYLNNNDKEEKKIIFLKYYLTSFAITAVISIINSLIQMLLENLTNSERKFQEIIIY